MSGSDGETRFMRISDLKIGGAKYKNHSVLSVINKEYTNTFLKLAYNLKMRVQKNFHGQQE